MKEAVAGFLQESIYLERLPGVVPLHAGEGIELDAVLLHQLESAHHTVEGGAAPFVDSISVMQLSWAVDGQSNENMVFRKN